VPTPLTFARFFVLIKIMAKAKVNPEDTMPKCWIPLVQWHNKYHYSKQKLFVEAVEDYWEIVFLAGNGTGKSHILYWTLITLGLGVHPFQFAPPPLHFKVLLNDFEHGYGKIFTETCLYDQYLPDDEVIKPMLSEDPYMVTKWPSRDDKTIHLYNGTTIFFQTSEQKKKQHSGTNFDALFCDEEALKQIYDESKRGLRTAKGGGRIFHAFTPPFDDESKQRGPSWTKFDLIDPWERGDNPDVAVIKASMKENPAITDEFIKRFSRGKTEEQIKIQVHGDYPTWGEVVHPNFQDYLWNPQEKAGNLLPFDFEIPWRDPEVLFEMSLDWHPSKPAGVVWSFTYLSGPNKGDAVFFDEISPNEGKGMTIMDVSKAIREHEGWRNIRIRRWGDPKLKDKNNALISGFNAWEEFRHCGIRMVDGQNRSPGTGIAIVNDYIRGKGPNNSDHPRVYILESLRTTRHHMKNHYWIRKPDGSAVPDPKFSDYCINVRYILHPKSKRQKKSLEPQKEPFPLTSLGGQHLQRPKGPAGLNRYLMRG